MNWIFEAYSNVYNSLTMQRQGATGHAADANGTFAPHSAYRHRTNYGSFPRVRGN